MARHLSLALSLFFLAAACGDPGGTTVDVAPPSDAAADVAVDTVIGDPDLPGVDAVLDTEPPPLDARVDMEADAVSEACETNEDCPAGVCVPTKYGKQCSKPCLEDCPPGWSCRQLPGGRDDTWACVPDHITTCRPCEDHADCQEAGFQPGGLCRDFGDLEGSFCATPCGDSIDCLAGYDCVALDGGGTYCLPADGTCECDPVATDRQLSTPCLLENEVGACLGERVCAAEGLTDCDAATPAAEVCDGADNDCDGDIDEGFGGAEECNGVDDDCDGETDEAGAEGCTVFYLDKDEDDYGVASASLCLCAAADQHTAIEAGDCDDTEAAAHPGAAEICDGLDNDCDGVTDPPGIEGTEKYYTDDDDDGYSDGLISALLCGPSATHTTTLTGDCDDDDPDVHPGADEICDGADNDCDDIIDGPATEVSCSTNCGAGIQACLDGALQPCDAPPESLCTDFSDCSTYLTCEACPAAPADDQCDGVDDDCDGGTDEDAFMTQLDGAVVTGPGQPCGAGACAGGLSACVGGALVCPEEDQAGDETCNDEDDDCDGEIDEGLLQPVWFDNDEDGYGDPDATQEVCIAPEGWVANALDCDDTDPALHPGAEEVCDGKDNDCNGVVDQVAETCDLGCAAGTRICVGGQWGDCDAPSPQSCMDYGTCEFQEICVTDCPAAPQDVCNGVDDDCDGGTDEDDPGGGGACQVPGLQGPCAVGILHCQGGAPTCTQTVFPQPETCDGVNNDCDDQTDETFPGMGQACDIPFLSGECAAGELACQGQAEVCVQVHFGTSETCNNKDDDCDGAVDGFTEACTDGCSWGTKTCTNGSWSACGVAPPECTSGPCCDGCNYRGTSYKCSTTPYATDYQCTNSAGCGGQAQERYRYRYCTGWSADCGTSNLQWDPSWTTTDWCSSNEPCVFSNVSASCTGTCDGQCVNGACCGGANEPCCNGVSCSGDNICVSGTCRVQPDATKTYRYTNLCTSAHWQAKNQGCYPGQTPTTACGGCSSTVDNGCGWSTCWLKEIGFWTYDTQPSWGSFFQIHHCFYSGGNFYSKNSCSAYGDPSTLGWIASSPTATWVTPIYLCNWSASGISEQFFTFATSECTNAGGSVATPSPWGYVVQ